jgi:DNA modification methylase
LDEQTGELSNVGSPKKIDSSKTSMFGAGVPGFQMYGDKGGASRFFYCPKTSKTDRNEGLDDKNNHPTVKPTDLMLYLIRLVTPKGGTTLDPFMGSGSTGKAAVRGGFDFIGIEREKDYMEIAEARIQYQIDNPYNEETGKRVEIKKETQQTLNKFFG